MQPQRKISAIDVTLGGEVKSTGIAHKDPNETYEEFFKAVMANEKVIGFEWDGEQMGIILG